MRVRAAALLLLAACSSGAGAPLPKATLGLTFGATTKMVRVEVAATESTRQAGLMGRRSLPDGTGMWFVYPKPKVWSGIWMKDTLIPLDVAFVQNGEIFEIHTLEPCPATTDACPVTTPATPYDRVLEVPAGWFTRWGLGIGTAIRALS